MLRSAILKFEAKRIIYSDCFWSMANIKRRCYNSPMAVSLTGIINGKPVLSDTLGNSHNVKCPLCEQEFRLGYSDGEWNRVKDWLGLAERAIREDHKRGHQLASLAIQWRPSRSKR